MPGQARKHGAAVKAAVAHAMNVQGMTAEQVVALAAKGQLRAPGQRERCRPVEIAESTCKQYAQRARRRDRVREREAATNGGYDHEEDEPPNLAPPIAQPANPWGSDPRLRAMLDKAREYDRALAEGERCACPRPQPTPYDVAWKPEGELLPCLDCNRPTPNRKDTYGPSRPHNPGHGADQPEAA